MAITIIQQPVGPRYSRDEWVYVVSSDNLGNSEFSYVMEILLNNVVIATRRKQPNLEGAGVFEISRIVDANLDYEVSALGAVLVHTSTQSSKLFTVRFKEEFLVNGTLTMSTTTVGAASVAAIKGAAETNEGDYNTQPVLGPLLTVSPTIVPRVFLDEPFTLSYLGVSGRAVHLNLPTGVVGRRTDTLSGEDYTYEVYDERSTFGEVSFVWDNGLGGWDYFVADQEGTEQVSVTRNTFKVDPVDFSGLTATNRRSDNSSAFRSSTANYGNSFNRSFTKDTRWLTEDEAKLVVTLFDSRSAFVIKDGTFIPVEITNGSYDVVTTTREQPLTNFTIEYNYSNGKRSI